MIDKIQIMNYKSIVDLTLEPGRFNVIIGTNGCGKSNVLEAITMASAASSDRLDNANLQSRNVRIADPVFMTNAFEDIDESERLFIKINVEGDDRVWATNALLAFNPKSKEWVNIGTLNDGDKIKMALDKLHYDGKDLDFYRAVNFDIGQLENKQPELYNSLKQHLIDKPTLNSFLCFCPHENMLREMSNSITYPLGPKGEGLFQYLKEISSNDEQGLFVKINNGLRMLDWFDGMNVPDGLLSKEYKLTIGDKYLKDSLHSFDQRSTNEGFLFLLFYLTLFNSADTPQFFAVDNIETSFNPGLCQSLTKYLVGVAKENDKQVVLTTHNPYVLDGLDLSDDEQRLFVCRRDIDGHTRIERVKYREDRKMSLSELWMSGLIGALPENF